MKRPMLPLKGVDELPFFRCKYCFVMWHLRLQCARFDTTKHHHTSHPVRVLACSIENERTRPKRREKRARARPKGPFFSPMVFRGKEVALAAAARRQPQAFVVPLRPRQWRKVRGFFFVVVGGGGGATKVQSITADDFDIWPHCRKTARAVAAKRQTRRRRTARARGRIE